MKKYNTATTQVTRKIDKPVYEKAIDAANRLERAMEQGWNENYHLLEENLLTVIRKMDSETRQAFLTWAYTTKMESGRAVGKELFDEVVLLFAISNLSQPEIDVFSKLDDIYHRCKDIAPDKIRNRDSLRMVYKNVRPQALKITSPVVAENVQEKLWVIDPALGFRDVGASACKCISQKSNRSPAKPRKRTTPTTPAKTRCCGCATAKPKPAAKKSPAKKPAAKKPAVKKSVAGQARKITSIRF